MYFPTGFNKQLSLELGELVVQAYDQFAAFEDDKFWKLPDAYHLEEELCYTWRSDRLLENITPNYDISIRKSIIHKKQKNLIVPMGFIAQREEKIFLIFRGTMTVKEWLRNFNIDLVEYMIPEHGHTHEGFLQTYKSIRENILSTLFKFESRHQLFVAGHSLGGALATLSLPDIQMNTKIKIKALYTYGSPRVGDDTFVKSFNSAFAQKSFRIVNTSDIVTSIPPPVPFVGVIGGYFSHIDTPIDFTIQNNDLEQNHAMNTYIHALDEAKESKGFLRRLFTGF